jgi:abortive infection bacteriophage resistance protein
MLYSRPATDIAAQVALLQGRGMACADWKAAERYLTTIGYYRLSAYWLPLENPPAAGQTRSKTFLAGVNFEDVLAIYIFDRKLRLLLLEAIERIEINVRSRWTNRLTLAHGPHAYLDAGNFAARHGRRWNHQRQLALIAQSVKQSNETFIQHYMKKYTQPNLPPLWAVTEVMTLGELSKWYAATADLRIQDAVARDLNLPNGQVLVGLLQALSLVRNICAHHARLWNRRIIKRIPNVKRWAGDIVLEPTNPAAQQQAQPENLIYNVLIAILHLLHAQQTDTSYPQRLKDLVETVTDHQRAAMGFPTDWRTRSPWGLT